MLHASLGEAKPTWFLAFASLLAAEPSEGTREMYWSARHTDVRDWVWVQSSTPVGWGGLANTYERCAVGVAASPDIPPEVVACDHLVAPLATGSVSSKLERRARAEASAAGFGPDPLGTCRRST